MEVDLLDVTGVQLLGFLLKEGQYFPVGTIAENLTYESSCRDTSVRSLFH